MSESREKMVELLNAGDSAELKAFLRVYSRPIYERALAIMGDSQTSMHATRRVLAEAAALAKRGELSNDLDAQLMALTDSICSEDIFLDKLVDVALDDAESANAPHEPIPMEQGASPAPQHAQPVQPVPQYAPLMQQPAPQYAPPVQPATQYAQPLQPVPQYAPTVQPVPQHAQPVQPVPQHAQSVQPRYAPPEPRYASADEPGQDAYIPGYADDEAGAYRSAPEPVYYDGEATAPAPTIEELFRRDISAHEGENEVPRLFDEDEPPAKRRTGARKTGDESEQASPLMVVLIFIMSAVTLFLVWLLVVKLMHMGVLPLADFGFGEWFNKAVFALF